MAKSKQAALIGEVGETFVANHLKKKRLCDPRAKLVDQRWRD
jgi:hypothetical protein